MKKILLFLIPSVAIAADKPKVWYTHPNERKDVYVTDEDYSPAFHLPQAPHKIRWELYTGDQGKEIPGYTIPLYELREYNNTLYSKKVGLNKNLEIWIENIIVQEKMHYYRVTDKSNVEKVSDKGVATFRAGTEFFWVAGSNIRRKK